MRGFAIRVGRWCLSGNVAGAWYVKPVFQRYVSPLAEERDLGWQHYNLYWMHLHFAFEWWVSR